MQRSSSELLIGRSSQQKIIDRSLIVRENILLGADRWAAEGDRCEAAKRSASIFCLSRHIGHGVETLPGGELWRTQIARELIGGPKLIILGEPTAGLDSDGINVAFSRLQS